ncbi:hypothetical protein P168DRAFT_282809 [Aspergillus campestris IBT 28561]|uniref:Late endosomal/lysosomal adaptor and MAPK and MTOR activator-domain-containing protein n=1 Tax=Aspergillus campestris (strain IBT 28561) TaxID=1392248 RepID=A0A2I1CZH4_ASPC2|nr:uncharacterized protein P168DRAFT_282809 [Aspergillus campestris IBT 28561]PKY03029.1 hypothetical protein P168DRAFT_282809 [Aspergillus campestris IBT 28561]
MGNCSSCLGLGRRDSHDSESSRLLDDDPYQAGYGYGALNHTSQVNQPDPGYIKREREALEAICQRASDSVIDIWSLQPQPHLQPQATLRGSASPSSTRGASSNEVPIHIATETEAETAPSTNGKTHGREAPKHWGEVVINPRKHKQAQADEVAGQDVFGVLKVT